ncbi:MAG TPA: efflux RND transporter periplasmic adaptor subunit [Thermoanaerobaculia bacterium]|nr:efflux RND transporter periplasmic adaptor subunit [Thermoanaerobaculia bacterium]
MGEAAQTRSETAALARPVLSERDEGFLGVVLPRQSVDVAPEIAGRIEQIHVREGDRVRRGQTVAVLGLAEIQQEVTMTEANLRAVEAEVSRSRLELADADNRLSRRLSFPEAFPQEEMRQAEIQKQMAQASLEAAQARASEQRARVAQARGKLARAAVRAPADGTVARRYLEPGALAGPGQPIVRLISGVSLIVRFAAPPEQARSLSAGQPVLVEIGEVDLPARIEQVSPEVDPPSGMVILVAVLDPAANAADTADTAGRVKPGSVVRVRKGAG